jgi:multidrug transporter EmrE-like cation transporter
MLPGMSPRLLAMVAFWFCAGVALAAFRLAPERPPAAIYFAIGAGSAFVGTVLTVMVPWGIRELWRHWKRGRVTALPPERRQPIRGR